MYISIQCLLLSSSKNCVLMKSLIMRSLSLYPLSIFLSILVLVHCQENIDMLQSCLTQNSVGNFSMHNSNTYYKFLYFSIQNLRFAGPSIPRPTAIIIPESKQELVKSVVCIRKGSFEVRVRCGGHSYEGTSYIANDGLPFVLIDMMNLNRVSIDLESKQAWVEGGATLGQTYYSIAESSRTHGFSAGSCPTVGIGGHIAGGGFGLLSRKYGLAADNVVDALLIDAEGRLLDREGMGDEVFWAIRGGGGGIWGIVYAWKIRLLKVPEAVTGFIVSRPGSKRHVLGLVNKWQHIAPKLEDGFYLSAFVGAGLPEAKTIGISATFKGFYLGSRTEAVSILNRIFPDLGIFEGDCKEMTWIESILFFSGLVNSSSISSLNDRFLRNRNFFKAKSDYITSPIPKTGLASAIEILEKEPKGYVILDPYGGAMDRISNESIAFPHRIGNIFTVQYLVEWKEEDNDRSKGYIEWIRGFYNAMEPYVSSGPRAAYINYMDLDLGVMDLLNSSVPVSDAVETARIWGEKYFLKNYDRLVRAKTLIDPSNVFRNQQGIPPQFDDASGRAQPM